MSRNRRFSIEYPHDGLLLSTTIHARDWADAEAQARAIRMHGRVMGEVVAELPAAGPAYLPAFGIAWLIASARNWWRRL